MSNSSIFEFSPYCLESALRFSDYSKYNSKAVLIAKLRPSISHLFLINLYSANSILLIIFSISWYTVSFTFELTSSFSKSKVSRNPSIFFIERSYWHCSSPNTVSAEKLSKEITSEQLVVFLNTRKIGICFGLFMRFLQLGWNILGSKPFPQARQA